MLKIIFKLEEGRVPDKGARGWQSKEKIKELPEKCKTLREEFEVDSIIAPNGLWNVAKKRLLEDRGALPEEEEDVIGEDNARR